jgi:tetratricopeptide (TPR) repeat protein
MKPEEVVDRLIDQLVDTDQPPAINNLLEHDHPHLTLEVIAALKQHVDNKMLRNAQRALKIAEIAGHLAPLVASPEARPLALWARGNALHYLSRYQEALDCYQQAELLYREQGILQNVAILQVNQVGVLQELGDFQGALALEPRARATCQALGAAARADLAALEVNIGLVSEWTGNLHAALEAYERGRHIFASMHNPVEVARIDVNRANVLEELDNFTAADALFASARVALQQSGQDQEVARCDLNLGVLAYRRGHYQHALRHLESAYRGFTTIPIPGEVAVVNLYRSFVYRDLNLIQEMISLANDAEQMFKKETIRWQQALALINQGVGYYRLGVEPMARQLLSRARHILEQQGAHSSVLLLDIEQAFRALKAGQVESAHLAAHAIQASVDHTTSPTLNARLALLLAHCALHTLPPDSRAAHQHAEAALVIATTHHLSDITIAAHHLMGQILEHYGDSAAALHHYQTAIETTEQVRGWLLLDEFQIGFMEDKLQIYADAVRLIYHRASPAQVFYTLNLASNAPLLRLDAAAPISQAVPHPASHDIRARLNELRETWHWYQSKLEGPGDLDASTPTERSPAMLEAVRKQVHDLEAEIADLLHRWRVHTTALPQPAADSAEPYRLFEPVAADLFLSHIQAHLQPHEILLHYTIINERFHALLVTHSTIQIVADLSAAAPLQRLLRSWRFHLEYLHLHRDNPHATLQVANTHMERLYTALLAPLEQHLAAHHHIFLVMPPAWHDLPIAACFDGQRYLIEHTTLTYLSAPEVLLTRSQPADAPQQPGALVLGYSDQGRLSHASIEARQVSALLQPHFHTESLLEEDATLQRLRAASQHIHLLHFATHAVFRQDNPLFSWIRLSDARLTVADLYEITLPQRPLVVLSACETGRGQPRGGGLLGMGRGFLAAGTAGLIVGLWKLDDQAAAQLMADLYAPNGTHSMLHAPAAALQRAQHRALTRNRHPFYWAGFIFIQG